ncbi:MAG: SirB2 family protein [Pseudomonadales bacterium]|nr:SirB2 family protein [Pseudomonadales bacterium]
MSYQLIKNIHLMAISLSICGFVLRGTWMMLGSRLINQRWVKVLPHIIDTVLLSSAVALAIKIHQYPFVHSWLTAKFIALLLYILFGMVALSYGKTKSIRVAAFCASLLAFSYIVMVALTKTPLPVW